MSQGSARCARSPAAPGLRMHSCTAFLHELGQKALHPDEVLRAIRTEANIRPLKSGDLGRQTPPAQLHKELDRLQATAVIPFVNTAAHLTGGIETPGRGKRFSTHSTWAPYQYSGGFHGGKGKGGPGPWGTGKERVPCDGISENKHSVDGAKRPLWHRQETVGNGLGCGQATPLRDTLAGASPPFPADTRQANQVQGGQLGPDHAPEIQR